MKNAKRLLSVFLIIVIMFTVLPINVFATGSLAEQTNQHNGWFIENDKWVYYEDGVKQIGWITVDGKKYLLDNDGYYVEGAHTFAIDISKWQGTVEWEKIDSSDVDAVILRSTYGDTKDSRFDEYINNLNNFEIPYGVYHYNTAKTVEVAQFQAQNVVEILKETGADPTLPVFVDIEEFGEKCDLIEIAKVYISTFITNGYKPGIYANEDYWKTYLNYPQFNAYYRWIAKYGVDNGYPSANYYPEDGFENYMMWQYTSAGNIDGIDTYVDFNALFDWYLKPDGWQVINGKYYYYKDGYITYGWFYENNNWYYLNNLGEMATEWVLVDGIWYYFAQNGIMQTGWQFIGNNWYWFDGSGAMKTGWLNDGGWYYINSSGAMVTDWQLIDGSWYYFNSSGQMQTGWLFDGAWYYMNNSGVMLTNWQLIDGAWYYFYADGSMASNCSIDGYWLTSSGAMA